MNINNYFDNQVPFVLANRDQILEPIKQKIAEMVQHLLKRSPYRAGAPHPFLHEKIRSDHSSALTHLHLLAMELIVSQMNNDQPESGSTIEERTIFHSIFFKKTTIGESSFRVNFAAIELFKIISASDYLNINVKYKTTLGIGRGIIILTNEMGEKVYDPYINPQIVFDTIEYKSIFKGLKRTVRNAEDPIDYSEKMQFFDDPNRIKEFAPLETTTRSQYVRELLEISFPSYELEITAEIVSRAASEEDEVMKYLQKSIVSINPSNLWTNKNVKLPEGVIRIAQKEIAGVLNVDV